MIEYGGFITDGVSFEDDNSELAAAKVGCLLSSIGACFHALKLTCVKVHAQTQKYHIQQTLKEEPVLPQRQYDVDFSRARNRELKMCEKIHNSISWKEIGGWTFCSVCLCGGAYYLI